MGNATILITGAGGNVGRALVQQLQERGVAYRIGVRTVGGQANAVPFDFLKAETYEPAIAGCKALFLLRPPAIANTKATLNPFIDVAPSILTAELGRPICYKAASLLGYALHLQRQGLPWMQILVQTILHRGLRVGEAETVTDTVPALLGRPARTLATYVHDDRDLWMPPRP
ncbi:hypothetical protein IQ273_08135 [Nodosilinea sp. LEGE 07298]|uniref:hypothetical protein n=1 Tax=Nodosilinea sp. LEGE 07298 TaxID=2777970 RepID=UPI00187F8D90|nr:hypothetical protein [Nodosilinea sp. LEGE 07298]MBE9109384.1 hypothetical protein [Nodosilinea sp. LEGE 07298]